MTYEPQTRAGQEMKERAQARTQGLTGTTTDLSWNMRVTAGLNNLKWAVHETAVEHGWWNDPKTDEPVERNMGEMIALMHSELSEALESYRDSEPYLWFKHEIPESVPVAVGGYSTREKNDDGEPGKPEGLAAEFADVIIRILDTCERLNIPITRALIVKHNYNLTRPYRHGGKLA